MNKQIPSMHGGFFGSFESFTSKVKEQTRGLAEQAQGHADNLRNKASSLSMPSFGKTQTPEATPNPPLMGAPADTTEEPLPPAAQAPPTGGKRKTRKHKKSARKMRKSRRKRGGDVEEGTPENEVADVENQLSNEAPMSMPYDEFKEAQENQVDLEQGEGGELGDEKMIGDELVGGRRRRRTRKAKKAKKARKSRKHSKKSSRKHKKRSGKRRH